MYGGVIGFAKAERGSKEGRRYKKEAHKGAGELRATESMGGVVLDAGVFKESKPRLQTQWIY
jgi:hypothetical protein